VQDLKERKKKERKKKEREKERKASVLNSLATPLLPLEKRFWASKVLPMRCVFFCPIMSTATTAVFVRRL
jgi:hypothetical protein